MRHIKSRLVAYFGAFVEFSTKIFFEFLHFHIFMLILRRNVKIEISRKQQTLFSTYLLML